MDQQVPNPPIMPQSSVPPVYGPVTEPPPPVQAPPPHKPMDFKVFGIIGSVIIILIVGSAMFASKQQNQPAVVPTPTPVAVATPTVQQTLTPFATGSAFVKFENNVTSFPSTLQNAVLLDQSIVPPTLDLPLGF